MQESIAILKSQIELSLTNHHLTEITFNIFNNFEVHWNYTLHMKLLSIFESFKLKPPKSRMNPTPPTKSLKWKVQFNKLNFAATLEKHCVQFDFVQGIFMNGGPFIDCGLIKLIINDVLMGMATQFKLCRKYGETNIEIQDERDETEGLELQANNSYWQCLIELFQLHFPHIHYFSDAIQNEFITTIKWLKIVHKKKKVPFTLDSPLPSDMLIKIKKCLFEIYDDPFEVRLRNNYELLVDEYKESLKRQQMLDKKISELRQTHLLLPAGKSLISN